MDFSVVDTFSLYAQLGEKLKLSINYVQMWKRNDRTIATAQKRMSNCYFNSDIKYCVSYGTPAYMVAENT